MCRDGPRGLRNHGEGATCPGRRRISNQPVFESQFPHKTVNLARNPNVKQCRIIERTFTKRMDLVSTLRSRESRRRSDVPRPSSRPGSVPTHSLCHSLTHSLTHTHTHTFSLSLSHTHTHFLCLSDLVVERQSEKQRRAQAVVARLQQPQHLPPPTSALHHRCRASFQSKRPHCFSQLD